MLLAASVYPVPVLSMDRPEKVAMPAATGTAVPPVSVPPPALFPNASATVVPLSPVSTLPAASSTATVTAGAIVAPATVVLGPTMKASLAAAPSVMSKDDEVAGV